MALHQAHSRSPKRTIRDLDDGNCPQRHYQAVKSFPVPPEAISNLDKVCRLEFEVSEEQFELTSKSDHSDQYSIPIVHQHNGSLRWRLRCGKPGAVVSEQRWITLDTLWPPSIFFRFNGETVAIRRRTHNGRDLAIELTDLVCAGKNVVEYGVLVHGAQRAEITKFAIAVELLETLSHTNLVALVEKQGRIPAESTLQTIKKRLTPHGDDGDGLVLQAPGLAIDLADPFSFAMFTTPVRGATCTHLECFDLETWLNTRPSPASWLKKHPNEPAPARGCVHSDALRCGCPPPRPEPSDPDKWKCPICLGDARPHSLRIDEFLVGVRAALVAEGKGQAKSLQVAADGTWRAVLPDDGHVESDREDDDGSGGKKTAKAARSQAKKTGRGQVAGVKRPGEIEVIEID